MLIDEKNIKIKSESGQKPKSTKEKLIIRNADQKVTIEHEMEMNERDEGLRLLLADGFMDCKFGLSIEGVFNKKLDITRVKNLANILGVVSFDKSEGYCTIEDLIDIFPEGAIVVKGSNQKEIRKRVKKLHAIVLRAMECIGCGICIGRCDNKALNLNKINNLEKIKVDEEVCTHCGNCLGPCPVVNFNAKESFEM